MTIDLSHLYETESVDVGPFTVTVREVPHGEIVALQRRMFGDVRMSKDKRNIQSQIENIRLDIAGFSDEKNVLAIQSWTLTDAAGNDVPVSLEAWQALPHHITEQIEEVVDRLNPDGDDDFQGDDGS